MSDVMLIGVLRMPPDCWSGDPIDVAQRHSRYVQAADTIDSLRSELSRLAAENEGLREQTRQLQARRDRIYEDMLYWRGIDIHNGEEPCKACGGAGVRAYGSTTTWRGGIGGQAITGDVCDKCWGSGNAKAPWLNLRTAALSTRTEVKP